MKAFLLSAVALGLALAGGCAGARGPMKSFTADTFPASAHQVIVSEVVDRLYSVYPPGLTAIFLTGADAFGLALDESLRNRGYSIMPEAGNGAMSLAWTVDRLDEETWYLVVRLSDGHLFARTYRDSGQTVTPAGGLSQGVF